MREIYLRSGLPVRFVAAAALLLGCGGSAGQANDGSEENVATSTEALTEFVPNQTKLNAFYAYDNVVNITVHLTDADWLAIKTERPNPDGCSTQPVDSNGESPSRFPWRSATNVTVSDSKSTTNGTFASGVEIRKKSYCGSLTTGANQKPSLKIRFSNVAAVNAMGTQYLTLNNSIQDGSYIRQTLGYYLFELAGLPRPRVNYAKVKVVTPTATEDLVYVNVEGARASLIGNPSNGFTNKTITQSGSTDAKAPGTLYEIEIGDDFNDASQKFIGLENVSGVQVKPSPAVNPTSWGKPDLVYASQQLALGTAAGLQKVINTDNFYKFWAMEVLLKHWDGYTGHAGGGHNNTYIYNDAVATAGTQTDATVDFKFIPSGIDQILQPTSPFRISDTSVVGHVVRSNPALYNGFISAVAAVRSSVFSRELLDGAINTRIEALKAQLISFGIDTSAEINSIKVQLKLARAAAIMLSGSNSAAFYIADEATGDVMHASNSETVGIYYEVYHRPSLADASDRWIQSFNGFGSTLISEAYNRPLYATASLKTAAGNYYVLTEPNGNFPEGEAWNYEYGGTYFPAPDGRLSEFPGTFALRSARTSRYLHFSGSDLTPAGRPRVYQGAATRLFLY